MIELNVRFAGGDRFVAKFDDRETGRLCVSRANDNSSFIQDLWLFLNIYRQLPPTK